MEFDEEGRPVALEFYGRLSGNKKWDGIILRVNSARKCLNA